MKLRPQYPEFMVGQNLYDGAKDYIKVSDLLYRKPHTETEGELRATMLAVVRRLYDASKIAMATMLTQETRYELVRAVLQYIAEKRGSKPLYDSADFTELLRYLAMDDKMRAELSQNYLTANPK